jgi:hypothetical protein
VPSHGTTVMVWHLSPNPKIFGEKCVTDDLKSDQCGLVY